MLEIVKLCTVCGAAPRHGTQSKCQPCYNEYMRIYMGARYRERRAEAVERLGGQCYDCGTGEQLEFDHVVRSKKSYNIDHGFTTLSRANFELELKKCVLRCRPCHIAKGLRMGDFGDVEHGGGASGKKNCPCGPCKAKKREWGREYKRKRAAARTDPVAQLEEQSDS